MTQREIYFKTLVTKAQAQLILVSMGSADNKVPPKGKMIVISFPDANTVGYLEWTKAISEAGERLYSYSLERFAAGD